MELYITGIDRFTGLPVLPTRTGIAAPPRSPAVVDGLPNPNRLDRQRAWAVVKRRAKKAGIDTPGICNHTFRRTGIAAYLENPETKLEQAQQMAARSDP